MRLHRKPLFRRRGAEVRPRRAVIELYSKGKSVLRIDLPMAIEEDADGKYPIVQEHDGDLEPLEIDGISVSMRHRKFNG